MTHDELLAKIDEYVPSSPHLFERTHMYRWRNALRAVVELHKRKDKPSSKVEFGSTVIETYFCQACKYSYPCPTIEAIEKELK